MAVSVFWIMARFEDGLYDQIVNKTLQLEMSDEKKAITLLHTAHTLLKPRLQIFGGQENINLRDTLFRSADVHLLDAKGACGSHTHVLGRMLQQANIPVRIAQMKCGVDSWGCHIVLEAKLNNKFVVLDPLFDMVFENEDGTLASFLEVQENWAYFQNQLPDSYNPEYSYQDVRYTNWEKIPILMPLAKKMLRVFVGDAVDTLSIRAVVLNLYRAYTVVILVFYLLLVMFTVLVCRGKVPDQSRS